MVYAYLLDLGINQAISRFLIDHKDNRVSGEYGALVKTSALVSAIQGLVVFAIVFFGAPPLSELMKIPIEYRDTFISVMRCQGAITAFIFCLNPFVIMLSAHQRMDVQAWQSMAGMILLLGFLVFFLATGHGIFSFIYANAINAVISPVYYFWICRWLGFMPTGSEWGKLSWKRFNEIFLYGKDVFLMNVGINLIAASQTIVVSRALGLETAATWTVGTRVFTLVRQVMYQPTGSSLPGLSEMLARKEAERLKDRFRNLVGLTASLGVFLGVVYALCNSLFVGIWTAGKISWSPLNDVLLALWLFVASIQTTHGSFVFVNKQIGLLPFIFMAEGCTYIAAALFGGYRWGIPGIIICSVVCLSAFSCFFSLRNSRRFFRVTYSTLLLDWLRPALKLAALLIPLAIALWLVTSGCPAIWRLIIHGMGAGLCGGLLFLRFGVPRQVLGDAMAHVPKFPFKARIKRYLDGASRSP